MGSIFPYRTDSDDESSIGIGLDVGIISRFKGIASGKGINDSLALTSLSDPSDNGFPFPIGQYIVQAVAAQDQIEEFQTSLLILFVIDLTMSLDGRLTIRIHLDKVSTNSTWRFTTSSP